ncbi:nuclear fragile X mental retardation-interacting protein 1-domain-containing protein [Vararia minispora EC-137]|uniref:Nuclear fragile X mental retardation-interacting protein 1-domain-containing protein n=1 Tax=Vararia minispora EC-137 TaxID=1314806 RepID=A0ACB8QYJ8_9AGAM|nr:nuclear fragile X mental retardation-interacting protein 1-domain-containing protein [Vararia minispora EC-137]
MTAAGYSYSRAYDPAVHGAPSTQPLASTSYAAPVRGGARGGRMGGGGGRSGGGSGYWYSPGSSRCTNAGCMFTGSANALEIHMMDRHLVYPLGWDKRKKKDDWDADPSLKGKQVYIQGTNMRLDTPEEIEKWIEERKRRFPTQERVEEKKRKLEDAIERGQLHPDDPALRGSKRRRVDEGQGDSRRSRGRGRGRGIGTERGWGRGRGRGRYGGARQGHDISATATVTSTPTPGTFAPLPAKPPASVTAVAAYASSDSSADSDDDDDGPPEAASSKQPVPALRVIITEEVPTSVADSTVKNPPTPHPRPAVRQRPPQPRKPPANPFAPKSSLLRSLLSNEIRMTVSNLSQAIHFLVTNDFLENVELKPGQAQEKLIEVIGETSAADEVEKTRDADTSQATDAPQDTAHAAP